jgi:hypothetical protein
MFSIITGRFRPSSVIVWAAVLAVGIGAAASCDKVPLLAPGGSTLSLSSNSAVVQSNGVADVRATVLESSGTPVQNGTTVTFSTNLGVVSPTEARTVNGVASTQFIANGQSGTAEVRAVSGAAKPDASSPLKLAVGAAAATRVQVSANPSRVSSGGSSTIIAAVSDANGNALAGIPVSFSTDAGSLSTSVANTNGSGQAQATLTTTKDATVTASAGGSSTATGTVKVTVAALPDLTIAASGLLAVGQNVTFTVTSPNSGDTDTFSTVALSYGDGDRTANIGSGGVMFGQHTYRTPGTYTVTATGTTSAGTTKIATTTVTIAPVVVTVTSSRSGNTASFTATVSPAGTSVSSYTWNFGDGTGDVTTATSSTSHTYTASGTYTATVTANLPNGQASTSSTSVTIP